MHGQIYMTSGIRQLARRGAGVRKLQNRCIGSTGMGKHTEVYNTSSIPSGTGRGYCEEFGMDTVRGVR